MKRLTMGRLGPMELTILRAESRTLQPSALYRWPGGKGPWAACVLRSELSHVPLVPQGPVSAPTKVVASSPCPAVRSSHKMPVPRTPGIGSEALPSLSPPWPAYSCSFINTLGVWGNQFQPSPAQDLTRGRPSVGVKLGVKGAAVKAPLAGNLLCHLLGKLRWKWHWVSLPPHWQAHSLCRETVLSAGLSSGTLRSLG